MHSSYSLPKCFVTVPILAMQLLLIGSASSLNLTNTYLNHKCRINQGKYRPGSKYEHNLNAISRDLTNWTSFRDGFKHETTRSDDLNSITIIFQCRGDSLGPKCGSCAATAVEGFRKRCPRSRGGIIWYDQCFLDISNFNDPSPRNMNYENTFSMYNPNNVKGDTKLFNKKTSDFLNNLKLEADKPDAQGLSFVYYAAGVENIGTNKLYAMVQCAKDIADCTDCLEWSIKQLPKCCGGKQGARVMGTSCNLRYEIYPFLRS